ncbi:hypothetical protein [Pontibacter populi]|uniref:hypothetical protein n=1 Tax=Pontibacter populi TaxID=890055 RepID=UPI003315220A
MKSLNQSPLILPENLKPTASKLPAAEHEFRNEFGKIYCKVSYLSAPHVIVAEWHGYSTKTQVEPVMNWIAEWCEKNTCTTLVNDCSNIKSVWFDTIEWFSRIWVQKMKQLGLQNFIHVANPGSFGDRIGERLQSMLSDQVQFLRVGLRADVMNWLENR